MNDLIYLVTFREPAAELPARILRAVADAVRENWRATDHGGPPVPERIIPAPQITEEWSAPHWADRSRVLEGRPEKVQAEFEFSPFTYRTMGLKLYRWPERIQAVISLTERALSGAYEGSYSGSSVESAGGDDWDRWRDIAMDFEDRRYEPNRDPEFVQHLDAVVFAIAEAGPSEGPEIVGDAHLPERLQNYSRLPAPSTSSPNWPPVPKSDS